MTAVQLSPVQQLAIRRWKGGHHAFHVLLVAMNTRLDQASELLDARAYDAAAPLLDELAGLYRAATALMRYASDFRTADYETLVRPSMMPPFTQSSSLSRSACAATDPMVSFFMSCSFGCAPTPVEACGSVAGRGGAFTRREFLCDCAHTASEDDIRRAPGGVEGVQRYPEGVCAAECLARLGISPFACMVVMRNRRCVAVLVLLFDARPSAGRSHR